MSLAQWSALRDKVKETISLKDLVEQYTTLKPIGNNVWSGHCPHPDHDDRIPSFRLFKNKNGQYTFKCFGCQDIHAKKGQNGNYGTDCFAFLQWMSDYKGSKKVLSFMDTLLILADKAGLPIPTKEEHTQLYQQNEDYSKLVRQNLSPSVLRYLYNRGLDDNDINKWKIGSWPFEEGGQTIIRIVFPLFDIYSRIVGFSSRVLEETNKDIPKYRNSKTSPIFQKKGYLYGCHLINNNQSNVIVTEGQFDVILAMKYNVTNVVATLGTGFSEDHVTFLKKKKLVPTFVYDNDQAGITATLRAIYICNKQCLSSNVCTLPNGQDLAEAALVLKEDLPQWINDHSVPSWQHCLEDAAIRYEAKLQKLRSSILPDIRRAIPVSEEDKILMKTFVKERFGITL